jgi:hypothetical protein
MGLDEQREEIEVLESIYDGDQKFKKLDDTVFQYQVCLDILNFESN